MSPVSSAGIRRNTVINVAGSIAPLLIALVTVPIYVRIVGEARYGVLLLAWVLLGYAGVFDLGLGRAVANQVAKHRGDPERRAEVVWTALVVNSALGLVGGLLVWLAGWILLGAAVDLPAGLRAEALASLPWVAAAIPLATAGSVLTGALEGRERFVAFNSLGVVHAALFQGLPLVLALWLGPELQRLVFGTTVAFAVSTALAYITSRTHVPLRGRPRAGRGAAGALARYGGWVTVASFAVVGFSTVDRILVGALAGPRAVTQYAVPMNIVTRLLLLPASVTRALFPRLSHAGEVDGRDLAGRAVMTLGSVLAPLATIALVCLEPFLHVWLGSDLADRSAPIGQIALLGIFVSSFAFVPYAQLQAQGRPDVPAKFALAQLVPYVGAMWMALELGGIEAAAWVWTGRMVVESVLLFAAARTSFGGGRRFTGSAVLVLATFLAVRGIGSPLAELVGVLLAGLTLVWAWRHGGKDVLDATRRELGRRGKTQPPELARRERTPLRTSR